MAALEVEEYTFTKHANVASVQPSEVTCRTAKASTAVDYFAMTSAAVRMLKEIRVDRRWPMKLHRPVLSEMTTIGHELQCLTYAGGPKIDAAIVQ
eukprot:5055874-Pyramimonas_sp.AAC.1